MSWERTTIGNISTQIRGVTYDKSDLSSGPSDKYITVLRAGNIQNGEILLDDLVYIDRGRVITRQFLKSGDVLIAASSGSLSMVGKAARIREDHDAAFGAFCKVLRPDTSRVDPNYFGHFFQTEAYRNVISNLAQGANINNIRGEHLDDLEIPLPPLPIQKRIAAVLDEVDALRQKRERSVTALYKLITSTFYEKVGNPIAPNNTSRIKKLSNIGRIITGNTPSRENESFYGDGIEWLKSDNLGLGSRFASQSRECLSLLGKQVSKVAPAGSLLTTCIAGSRESIGKTSIIDRDVAFNQQINALIPFESGIENYLLAHFWTGKKLVQAKSTDSMKGLVSKSAFETIEFIMPDTEDARALDKIFKAIFLEIELQRNSLTEYEALQSSFQARAFAGELELRELALG